MQNVSKNLNNNLDYLKNDGRLSPFAFYFYFYAVISGG
jgi:hypothetical protein